MNKKFVCLANSHRDGGRCIAGLLLNDSNQPTNKWIRPIKKNSSAISEEEAKEINILQIIEITNLKPANQFSWRPEDYYYDNLRSSNGIITSDKLDGLENNQSELCNNFHYDIIDSDKDTSVKNLKSSLALLKGKFISIDKSTKKCKFIINNKITINKKTYTGFKEIGELQSFIGKDCFFIVSIGENPYDNGKVTLHYKLIAEIIPLS